MKKLKLSYFTVYLFCLLAVCLLFYVYGYQPINSKTTALQAQHQTDIAKIAQNDDYVEKLNSLKADTAKLAAKLEEKKVSSISGSAIADDVNAGLHKASITMLSRVEQGAETASASKVASSDGKTLCSVPITMSFKCTALQLTTLLAYYEGSTTGAYYVDKVSSTIDQKNANQLSVNLTMSIYYFSTQPTTKSGGK